MALGGLPLCTSMPSTRSLLAAHSRRSAFLPKRNYQRRGVLPCFASIAVGERAVVKPKTVNLKPLDKALLKPNPDLPDEVFNVDRPMTALVYEDTSSMGRKPAIVFGHGFSQPPANYLSTIESLCNEGWLVICPTTGIPDIFLKSIEGTKASDKMPNKLQTAVILDQLRCVQHLRTDPAYQGRVSEIAWAGHSLGAASAVAASSHCKAEDCNTVAVFAPQLSQMAKTLVNNDICQVAKTPKCVKAAHAFFTSEFPKSTPLVLIAGDDDMLAPAKDVELLFTIAHIAREGKDVIMYTVNGSHIGFEDQVNVEVKSVNFLLAGLFKLINFLVYNVELLKFMLPGFGDPSVQKQDTQKILLESLKPMLTGKPAKIEPVKGEWQMLTQPRQKLAEEVRRLLVADEDKDFSPLSTGLLLAYAMAQGMTCMNAAGMVQQSLAAGGSLNEVLGLVIAAGMAGALTFENALLASGRLLENDKPLLKQLSKFRYLAHSGVPLLLITGMDMADRAGVPWAHSPSAQGLIGLAVLGIVGVSTLRNTLLLQLSDKWEAGVLRYTYTSPQFIRIMPAIITCVMLTVMGTQAGLRDHELWPFAAGPLACTVLSAIPSSVAPPFLVGNLGEVLLLGGLVYTEWLLRGMNL